MSSLLCQGKCWEHVLLLSFGSDPEWVWRRSGTDRQPSETRPEADGGGSMGRSKLRKTEARGETKSSEKEEGSRGLRGAGWRYGTENKHCDIWSAKSSGNRLRQWFLMLHWIIVSTICSSESQWGICHSYLSYIPALRNKIKSINLW